jgi:hypothetical protein
MVEYHSHHDRFQSLVVLSVSWGVGNVVTPRDSVLVKLVWLRRE